MIRDTLSSDGRGLVFHLSIIAIMGLVFLFLAFVGWLLHSQSMGMDMAFSVLWDWSWLFAAVGAMLLALRIPDFRIVAGVPIIVAVLWYFVVMG